MTYFKFRYRFQLKPEQILNSRKTSFEESILGSTDGRGVDLVLNSLADDKLQASVRVLAAGGRFLEIGKFDLSKNAGLGMGVFLKNISFHGILLDALFNQENLQDRKRVVELVAEGIRTGVVKPLPRTLFQSDRAEEAFRFMATGKHIGKVILKIRDEKVPQSEFITREVVSRLYLNPGKTFIVFGGLGGFGLELGHWLVGKGVRGLVMVSRSGVTNGYQALQIARWRALGVRVLLLEPTMDSEEDALALIQQCSELGLGPVGGIFNLAMVIPQYLFISTQIYRVVNPGTSGSPLYFFETQSRD